MEELNQAPVTSIEQALAGRIAGLNIILADGSPGAEATVNIRGGGVSQDTAPLYVIDGFPMENFSLNTLDPRSIASIEVLKDASSIAIYGSRGANGVIIINTKEGEAGKPRVTYDYNISFNTRPKFIKMMNAYEYVKLQLELDAIDNRSYSIDRYLGAIDETTGQRPVHWTITRRIRELTGKRKLPKWG
ncbi:TonB-dependent receptor plug domain-containing protein [Bacteroides sp. CR5/BHMF/2]|nr:TonB-dependent receptor plug domain-containing protein [Bacteroides sp. CR5/BHMF/2]